MRPQREQVAVDGAGFGSQKRIRPFVESIAIHRPRNLDWKRASALLYGDWGTSKAYVIGLAFVASGFSSLPIIVAVCILTAVVGMNYLVVCRCFPDGGGVYSAAGQHGKMLAVVGSLLLVADLTVTAALSGWAALSYLGVPQQYVMVATIAVIILIGVLNLFGPRHSGSFAVALALPTMAVVVAIILLSARFLTFKNLEPLHENFGHTWVSFVGVILALSGVEAIANLTGTLKPDKGSVIGHPKVGWASAKAIIPVAIEVSVGTALLGWALLSLPKELAPEMVARKEDMLRFVAEQYGTMNFGPHFGMIFGFAVGVIFSLLLLSAVNTAVAALIGLLFMMSREGDMPRGFSKLNPHGVPLVPLVIAVAFPVLILLVSSNFEALAGLYAIGVVGAICVNLGSCATNMKLPMHLIERVLMAATFFILAAVEITLARTKPEALFFVVCVLVVGLGLWAYSRRLGSAGSARSPSPARSPRLSARRSSRRCATRPKAPQRSSSRCAGSPRHWRLHLTRPSSGRPRSTSSTSMKSQSFIRASSRHRKAGRTTPRQARS